MQAGQQQRRQAGASARVNDGGAGPSGGSGGSADRTESVTLASDLLGMPSLPQNYSAKVGLRSCCCMPVVASVAPVTVATVSRLQHVTAHALWGCL